MNTGRIRAVAVDLDGTLLDYGNHIPEVNLSTLCKLYNGGIPVIICTGRSYAETMYALNGARFHDVMALLTGAQIYDRKSDTVLWQRLIPSDEAALITEYLNRNLGGLYYVYSGRAIHMTEQMRERVCRIGLGEEDARMTAELARFHANLQQEIVSGALPCEKIFLVAGDMAEKCKISRYLKEHCGAEIASASATKLEIMPRCADKGKALRYILKRLNIDPMALAAFGDSENDLSMLRMAGVSIAMANSEEILLRASDYIAPKNTIGGFSSMVEQLIAWGWIVLSSH